MASLRVVVVSALLACALADTLTPDQLRQQLKDAVAACVPQEESPEGLACKNLCQYKYVGMLDKDGRYVESKVAEAMATMVYDGILNQEQVTKIAKTCNSVNEDIQAGCARGQQVFKCIDDEILKQESIAEYMLRLRGSAASTAAPALAEVAGRWDGARITGMHH